MGNGELGIGNRELGNQFWILEKEILDYTPIQNLKSKI
ncbi:hypothetical protein NIES3585_42050 [Nodularia sp. NIES-3585]|nr:hypothetical protein NIES3585_42050 [Nodularia sp. NIES-3585]